MARLARPQFRLATPADAESVAALHTDSWRRHYRGAYSDDFLDGDVAADRLTVWTERLQKPDPRHRTILAEDGDGLVGFAHTVLDDDPTWGALLDNLHVAYGKQRQRVGSQLLTLTARAVAEHADPTGLYLWVLEQNTDAQAFTPRTGQPGWEAGRYSGPVGYRRASTARRSRCATPGLTPSIGHTANREDAELCTSRRTSRPTTKRSSELLARHGAADLVTTTADGLLATTVPFTYDRNLGVLTGHPARNNDQWARPALGEAMVIMRGPDSYISPSWYPSTSEHGRVVPPNLELHHRARLRDPDRAPRPGLARGTRPPVDRAPRGRPASTVVS